MKRGEYNDTYELLAHEGMVGHVIREARLERYSVSADTETRLDESNGRLLDILISALG